MLTEECPLPESRNKYLYERLGDQDFQLLINALLSERYSDYFPLPVRQSDGGRDGIRRSDKGLLVYQVKWSVSADEKNPVSWLAATVKAEEANIRALVKQGAKQYFLVTNVASTGRSGSGTFDKLDAELRTIGADFGINMQCLWRESVDSMVDSAPDATKWAYADMLAGWDLIRYLIDEHFESRRDSGLRDLIRKVAATQWDEDDTVKFSQVDIDRERVVDLFVDVNAERLRAPQATADLIKADAHLGGSAAHLLREHFPFTLVLGAPGQGKSTLSQYVCQVHRAAFVSAATQTTTLPKVNEPRFPIRFDLSAYAAWTRGVDVFDTSSERPEKSAKARLAAASTIECFVAELMSHAAGGIAVTPKDVQDLFERVPALVVLDGLDEVGSPANRTKVVRAIDAFCGRAKSYTVAPKVVVTTRPSGGQLAEPSAARFEVITLNPLDPKQREEYLRKWCGVRGIHGREGRTLRTSFKEKSAEPYIGELAGNPMQLTILLELLHQQGLATPTQRTELYDAYLNLLLAREANKHPASVRKHRKDLMEIIPFLGWYLQSRSEERNLQGKMSTQELDAAMRHFQRTYGKPESVVDELFEATTDRVWALTSKEEGVYEFEVVSLREYFAANFLYNFAGEGDRDFDRATVLRELLRRPFWLNTARFYGGNAHGSDIYVLTAGIRDELTANPAKQVHVGAWTLLTDGVFASRPSEAASVVEALCADSGAALLLEALGRKEIRPLPSLPSDPSTNPTWIRLTTAIASNPGDPENATRVRVLRELLSQRPAFARWWAEQMAKSVGTDTERAWLELAAECEAAGGVTLDLTGVELSGDGAELVLNTGLVPPKESQLAKDLHAAVLDGQCPDVHSIRSFPAQVAVAFSPNACQTTSKTGFTGQSELDTRRRQDAIKALRRDGSPLAGAAAARRFKAGEKGSTFPWAHAASELFKLTGRCWLASEIAIIGGASKHQTGHTTTPGPTAFGSNSHPATLLAQARANVDKLEWWQEQWGAATDDLAKAEWVLAIWAIASGPVISELFSDWEHRLEQLPTRRQRAVVSAASRLASWGFLAGRRVSGTATTTIGAEVLSGRVPTAPRPAVTPAPTPPPPRPPGAGARPQRPGAPVRPGGGTAPSAVRPPASLSQVAKTGKWLQVDRAALYQ